MWFVRDWVKLRDIWKRNALISYRSSEDEFAEIACKNNYLILNDDVSRIFLSNNEVILKLTCRGSSIGINAHCVWYSFQMKLSALYEYYVYIYEAFKNSRTIHLILMKNVKKKNFLN